MKSAEGAKMHCGCVSRNGGGKGGRKGLACVGLEFAGFEVVVAAAAAEIASNNGNCCSVRLDKKVEGGEEEEEGE
jgi:hypothetical protein